MNPSSSTPTEGCLIAFTRWFLVLLLGGLLAGGGVSLWHGLAEREKNTAAGNWPITEARVLRAWVKTSEFRATTTQGLPHRGKIYQVMVEYTYVVNGRMFSGRSLGPRQVLEDEGEIAAQAIADSYAPGSSLPVYYQPDKPSESRLCRVQVSSTTWQWFAVWGGLAIPPCLLGIWWLIWRYERKGADPK